MTEANNTPAGNEPLPWGLEGIAHRVGKLEGLVSSHANKLTAREDHAELVDMQIISLIERVDVSDSMHAEHKHVLKEIHGVLKEMKILLQAWNKVKNTVSIVRAIGDTVKWIVVVGAAAGVLWAFALRGYSPAQLLPTPAPVPLPQTTQVTLKA